MGPVCELWMSEGIYTQNSENEPNLGWRSPDLLQLGIALGFLIPPVLVPNVDDLDELGNHIRVMFYINAGVTTVSFILVVLSKT